VIGSIVAVLLIVGLCFGMVTFVNLIQKMNNEIDDIANNQNNPISVDNGVDQEENELNQGQPSNPISSTFQMNADYDVCTNGANPGLQIEPLMENGSQVTNAYMGLDLNSQEVANNIRYHVIVPTNAYIQYYQADNHKTFEAVGPTNVVATAYTIWCNNSGWLNQTGYNDHAGQHRQINAKNMPDGLGEWGSAPQ
jgi:hypothetical protein